MNFHLMPIGNVLFARKTGAGEVTPDKKVIWVFQDWKTLGSATAVQVLDDPGIPENPGDLER